MPASVQHAVAIPDSLLLSLVGFLVVFLALVALIAVVKILTVVSDKKKAAETAVSVQPEAPAPAPVSAPAPVPAGMVPAKGSLGEIILYEVDDTSAALIMAIVADKLKAPLNTLRFKSIRLISEVE